MAGRALATHEPPDAPLSLLSLLSLLPGWAQSKHGPAVDALKFGHLARGRLAGLHRGPHGGQQQHQRPPASPPSSLGQRRPISGEIQGQPLHLAPSCAASERACAQTKTTCRRAIMASLRPAVLVVDGRVRFGSRRIALCGLVMLAPGPCRPAVPPPCLKRADRCSTANGRFAAADHSLHYRLALAVWPSPLPVGARPTSLALIATRVSGISAIPCAL